MLQIIGWLGCVMLAVALSAQAMAQRVGQEIEVDQGYYLTLFYEGQGWRIWKTETREGVRCKAIKPLEGRAQPRPSGFQDLFLEPTPFLQISRGYQNKPSIDIRARYGYDHRWRAAGERFWNESLKFTDLEEADGSRIEINSVTYEYEAIYVGRTEENDILDLTGFSTAMEMLFECDPEFLPPKPRDTSVPLLVGLHQEFGLYTSEMLRRSLEGVVHYRADISETGKVLRCEVTQSSGHELLDNATCPAIEEAEFLPALDDDGQPIEAIYEAQFHWRL